MEIRGGILKTPVEAYVNVNAGLFLRGPRLLRKLTPVEAIRLKCLDCSGGSSREVSLCNIEECPLYLYRFGKNSVRKLTPGNKKIEKMGV